MKLHVITISDRASKGEYEDQSGPSIEEIIYKTYHDASISREIVPDEHEEILGALERGADSDIILTTGGTGISERDITPEVSRVFCDRELPGIAEALRMESYRETPNALLSRGFAGMKGRCLVINLPGSVKAAQFCTRIIAPILEHAVAMAAGGGH